MANYTSVHTGQQVDSSITKVLELVNTSSEINLAVGRALKLDDIAHVSDELIDGVSYHVLWKVKPTSSNNVVGFAMHPTNGKLTFVYSNKSVLEASYVLTTSDTITSTEINALFD